MKKDRDNYLKQLNEAKAKIAADEAANTACIQELNDRLIQMAKEVGAAQGEIKGLKEKSGEAENVVDKNTDQFLAVIRAFAPK